MAQAETRSEKICIDELFLSEYLGALLKSTPPMNLDLPPAWASEQEPAAFSPRFSSRMSASQDSDQAALIETLRKENEQLKFNAELAKIDVEVLRGENQKLTSELATVKTTLDSTQTALKDVRERNKALANELAPLEQQVKSLSEELLVAKLLQLEKRLSATANTIEQPTATSPVEAAAPAAPAVHVAAPSLASSQSPERHTSPVADQLQHDERSIIVPAESVPSALPRVLQATEPAPDKRASSRDEAKRKLLMIVENAVASPRKKPFASTSRVIRPLQSQIEVEIREPATPQPEAVTAPPSYPQTPVEACAEPIQPPSAQPEPETADTVAASQPKSALNTDEIKLEEVAPTKAMKQKNADNYLQVQHDSDETITAAGYSITVK